MNPWICDGIPKDGKTYSSSGAHEPFENYGPDCAMCGLPKEAMGGGGSGGGGGLNKVAIAGAAAVVVAVVGIVASLLFKPQPQISQIPSPTSTSTPTSTPTLTPTATPTQTQSPGSIINLPANFTTYRTLADVPDVPSTTVNYGGSTTFAPLRSPEIEQLMAQSHPGFELRYVNPPEGEDPAVATGIRMLLDGQLSFAQSSRSLEASEYDEAKTKGFTLEQIPVAIDEITLYVNPQLSIPGLNLSQVKDIFTGKITNWKQVGGPDLPITIFSRSTGHGGTPEYFQKEVLGGEPFASNLQEVSITTTGIQEVAKTPGGISYATASEVINQQTIRPLPLATPGSQAFVSPCGDSNCQTLNKTALTDNTYPITRRLFIVIKRDGKIDEQAGLAYANLILSDEGQQLVEQAGFVPIRK